MSPRRRAAHPPDLPGFTSVELIGSGGFADVFLYEQDHPRRRVAVKVLHVDRITESATAQFVTEADVMAMLSTHPSIVTIYGAGESADGRPYIVMEYAPRPNLQVRYKQERFSLAEALRIGVQIGAAVETAHRAGIMHRDIKPANILVTEYNRPALTDFGIASSSIVEMSAGLSIPWSAPELFAEKPYGGPEADVYALAATVYTLLAGHSPFEGPVSVSSVELIDRIERSPVPSIDRPDVPEVLEHVLARAMAKRPEERPPTAIAFARSLQRLQIEFSLGVTPIDIIDDTPDRETEVGEEDGLTRVRPIASITPEAPAPEPAAPTALPEAAPVPTGVAAGTRRERRGTARPSLRTALRGRRGRLLLAGGVAAGIVVAGASVVSGMMSPTRPAEATSQPQEVRIETVPTPEGLRGVIRGDEAIFTWDAADLVGGDAYLWWPSERTEGDAEHRVLEPTAQVPLAEAGDTCIEVVIHRADGRISATPARACAD